MKTLGLIPFLFIFFNCNKSDFSPMGEFKNKLTVYCILDPRKDKQLVKVQQNAPALNTEDSLKLLAGMQVKIFGSDGMEYDFKDTSINEIKNYDVFYSKDFKFQPGGYTLHVYSDEFPLTWGAINIPDKLEPVSIQYFTNRYLITFNLIQIYDIYNFKFIIDYKKKVNGVWLPGSSEVQIRRGTDNDHTHYDTLCIYYYDVANTKSKIFSDANSDEILFGASWLISYVYSTDLSTYINAGNGFADPYTVRLDIPNWTNMINGYGIFGAIRSDSIKFPI